MQIKWTWSQNGLGEMEFEGKRMGKADGSRVRSSVGSNGWQWERCIYMVGAHALVVLSDKKALGAWILVEQYVDGQKQEGYKILSSDKVRNEGSQVGVLGTSQKHLDFGEYFVFPCPVFSISDMTAFSFGCSVSILHS